MRKEDKAKYNYKRIEIYLSPKDAALFEKKAIHYKNWGPFVRDAVKQFNDIGILRRIDVLNEMTALLLELAFRLCRIGVDFNCYLFRHRLSSRFQRVGISSSCRPA